MKNTYPTIEKLRRERFEAARVVRSFGKSYLPIFKQKHELLIKTERELAERIEEEQRKAQEEEAELMSVIYLLFGEEYESWKDMLDESRHGQIFGCFESDNANA